MPFVNSRLTFCTLSPVFYLPRTAGRGKSVRKTLKTHIIQHFMPLGVVIASFILTTTHVSFEKMSMKWYPDLRHSSLLKLWFEKRINLGKMWGKLCFFIEKRGLFLLCWWGPQTDPLFEYSMHISDMNFLCLSAKVIFNNKKVIIRGHQPTHLTIQAPWAQRANGWMHSPFEHAMLLKLYRNGKCFRLCIRIRCWPNRVGRMRL